MIISIALLKHYKTDCRSLNFHYEISVTQRNRCSLIICNTVIFSYTYQPQPIEIQIVMLGSKSYKKLPNFVAHQIRFPRI